MEATPIVKGRSAADAAPSSVCYVSRGRSSNPVSLVTSTERGWILRDSRIIPDLAAVLVALNLDVIIANSTPAAIAAKRVTTVIPIVMFNVSDPVGTGLVESLTRPGGKVTGGIFGPALAAREMDLHT